MRYISWIFVYGVPIWEFRFSNMGSLLIVRIFAYGFFTFSLDVPMEVPSFGV